MTGTTYDVKYSASAWPQLVSRAIVEASRGTSDTVGVPACSTEEQQFARDFQKSAGRPEVGLRTSPEALGKRQQSASSNDNGDVSWVVPAGLLNFPASVPGIEYHAWHAAVKPVSSISHKGQAVRAKVLAGSIIDLLTSPELLAKAHAEFKA